jgi:hypothetical protein
MVSEAASVNLDLLKFSIGGAAQEDGKSPDQGRQFFSFACREVCGDTA